MTDTKTYEEFFEMLRRIDSAAGAREDRDADRTVNRLYGDHRIVIETNPRKLVPALEEGGFQIIPATKDMMGWPGQMLHTDTKTPFCVSNDSGNVINPETMTYNSYSNYPPSIQNLGRSIIDADLQGHAMGYYRTDCLIRVEKAFMGLVDVCRTAGFRMRSSGLVEANYEIVSYQLRSDPRRRNLEEIHNAEDEALAKLDNEPLAGTNERFRELTGFPKK